MSVQLLRNILQSRLDVTVESTPELVASVAAKIAQRRQTFVTKGLTPPQTKRPLVEAPRLGRNPWTIRPIDLLHKLGRLTIPSSVNLSRLSASWATRRYFWAIEPATPHNSEFRLSADARAMDFHQKTLLSDEFGIAFAGLMMEEFYQAPRSVDISIALADPNLYQGMQQTGSAQPDYLMWDERPGAPFFVVECKGCQTSLSASLAQLRRGMEQVPSVVFAAGERETRTLVIATLLEKRRTRVMVLDPPDDDEVGRFKRDESVSDKVADRVYRIKDGEKFIRRAQIADDVHLLRWSGQFGDAARRVAQLGAEPVGIQSPNLQLERREVAGEHFEGFATQAFPELGNGIRVFSGVEEELLRTVREEVAHRPQARAIENREDPAVSTSRAGTCMLIEGLY